MAALFIIGCKKKDDANPSTDMATMTASVQTDSSLKVNVHYTDKNTESYQDDIIKVYYNDTFTNNTTVDPKPVNSDFGIHFTSPKYYGSKYKVELVREYNSPSYRKVTILTISGN